MALAVKPNIMSTLVKMYPTSSFVMRGESWDHLEWMDVTVQPDRAAVFAQLKADVAEWDYQEYTRQRAAAYPSIQSQLDTLFHEGYDGWKEQIQAIKDAFPKPTE